MHFIFSSPSARLDVVQPVTFVCRSRDGSKEYFFIVFDIIDDKREDGHLSKEGEPKSETHAASQKEEHGTASSEDQQDDLGVD